MSTYGGPPPRLINVRTLRLDSIIAPGPRYAILSHTWGGAEVTYQEWQQGGAEYKEGYAKILGACREAKRNQLDYLWVDTCCIDKQSSAELSRAINSMYGWYQRAAVCFAYLSDLQVHVKAGILHDIGRYMEGSPEKATLESLERSRWFTRGWTLQELLAPHDVWFFGSDWMPLGRLDDLADPISRFTGIDADALTHRKPLTAFSIAQRLSWASTRVTKEIEDEAYCLLGICEVNLSPTYGEGKNAFLRLQEQLFRSGDDSVLAWDTTDNSRVTDLFAASPADYVNCGDVVLDRSRAGQSNFWVTTVGLTGSMFTLDDFDCRIYPVDTRKVAILSCRWKNEESSLLALGLQAEILANRPLKGRYSITPWNEGGYAGRFPIRTGGRRLLSVREALTRNAQEEQITISKHGRSNYERSGSFPNAAKDPRPGDGHGGEHTHTASPGLEPRYRQSLHSKRPSRTPSPPRKQEREVVVVKRDASGNIERAHLSRFPSSRSFTSRRSRQRYLLRRNEEVQD